MQEEEEEEEEEEFYIRVPSPTGLNGWNMFINKFESSNTMKILLTVASLLAVSATAQESCAEDNGNWFCQAVRAIVYTQVGGSGAYNKVTNMDSDSGSCSSSPYEYSGNVAPLDEEVRIDWI